MFFYLDRHCSVTDLVEPISIVEFKGNWLVGHYRICNITGDPIPGDEDQMTPLIELELCDIDVHGVNFDP